MCHGFCFFVCLVFVPSFSFSFPCPSFCFQSDELPVGGFHWRSSCRAIAPGLISVDGPPFSFGTSCVDRGWHELAHHSADSLFELFQLDSMVLSGYTESCHCTGGHKKVVFIGLWLRRFLLQRAKAGFSCTSRLEFNLQTHKRPIVPRELEGSQTNYLQPGQKS